MSHDSASGELTLGELPDEAFVEAGEFLFQRLDAEESDGASETGAG